MCVEDRCTIVTSASCSQSAPQMSNAELLLPIDDDLLAGVRVGSGVRRGVVLVAAEDVLAGQPRDVRLAGHPGGQHQLRRAQGERLAVALDLDGPLAGLLGVRRAGGDGARPVRHLHHLGVELQPVADLVLGGEHGPVVRELEVRQVVVPDRVVQAQRLVAAAPLVAGPRRACRSPGWARRAGAAGPRGRCRPGRRRPPARRAGWCCPGSRPRPGDAPSRWSAAWWRRARHPSAASRSSAPRAP